MDLDLIKHKMQSKSIYFSDDKILGKPTVIAYEKKVRWRWFLTQLNTFIVATDFSDREISKELIQRHLKHSLKYAFKNYDGWVGGIRAGIGVISILISDRINDEAKEYCLKLGVDEMWAQFPVPVVIDSKTGEFYSFEKMPLWGSLYYPHFNKLINSLK